MRSVIVEFPEGSVKKLQRSVSSAKDVLYFVPEHTKQDRPVKTEIFAEEKLPVASGNNFLEKGKYEVDSIHYKYVTVLTDEGKKKVDIKSGVAEVKVTQDE